MLRYLLSLYRWRPRAWCYLARGAALPFSTLWTRSSKKAVQHKNLHIQLAILLPCLVFWFHPVLHTNTYWRFWNGIRTRYTLITSQLLYQMSYPLERCQELNLKLVTRPPLAPGLLFCGIHKTNQGTRDCVLRLRYRKGFWTLTCCKQICVGHFYYCDLCARFCSIQDGDC